MKVKIIALSLLSLKSFAVTDWNQLLTIAKKAEIETVTTSGARFDVVKLPGSRVRFYGFKGVQSADMKVVIHSAKKDLEKICNDYSVFQKGFQAELRINIPAISEQMEFTLADGRALNSSLFENKFEVGDVQVDQLPDDMKFPWTMSSADYLKFGSKGVKQGFVQMLNTAIKGSQGEVVVDLSKYNGLACDLAAGYVRPNLNRTVNFERALPEASYWINLESFTEVYRSFWNDHSRLKTNTAEEMKASELVLMGISIADKNSEKDKLLEKSNRISDFLDALKHKSSVLNSVDVNVMNPQEQWNQTFEYSTPKVLQVSQKLSLFNKKIDFSIEE